MPYLKLDHITKTFARGSQKTSVLADVTLAVDKGEFVSIIGHSGCGKTTVLNIVAGLVAATTGGVLLEDHEVNEPGPDRAVVFQNHSLLPWLTVYGNVRLAVDKVFAAKKTRAERHAWTMHNLDLVQMAHAKDRRPAEISGGMKQRAGIARALAVQPEVVLMDEPASALDPIATGAIEDLMKEIKDKYTIVIVTHNMQQATRVSDRTAFYSVQRDEKPGKADTRTGVLVEYGPTAQIFEDPKDTRTQAYVTGRMG